MSSILEALRELEGQRPPAVRREIPPPENPSAPRRASGALIPLTGGLAIGVLAFVVYAWGPSALAPAPSPAPEVVASTPPADGTTADRPAWLDTADAPRARVNRGLTPAPAPERAAAAPERTASAPTRTAAPAPPEPAAEDARAEPRQSSSGGQVAVESIAYAANAAERTATMRFHGRRVTVRQRDSVDGIEVQLIMPNGVYLQRGSEVYLLPLTR